MAQEKKQFSAKFDLLPPVVQLYFSHDFCGDLVVALAKDYKLEPGYVYNLVFDAVNHDFDLTFLRKEVTTFGLVGLVENSFFQDFVGKILLPIGNYLGQIDVRSELVKLGGQVEKYQSLVEGFADIVENENLKEVDQVLDLYGKINVQEERSYALDLLRQDLKTVLFNSGLESTLTLNAGLVYLLNSDANFKIEAVRALLENSEPLTAGAITLEDKAVSGTVANWLKDFIKVNGSEIFDELVLAEYLSSSLNAKKLTAKEKDWLRKLLKFYRHLSFFPESFGDLPADKWQLIPISEEEKEISSGRRMVDVLSEEPVKPAPKAPVAPSVSPVASPLVELQAVLTQYAPGSFEYKAIAQEIERLKKKK